MTGADLDKLTPEELATQISNPQQSSQIKPISGNDLDTLSPDDLAMRISQGNTETILDKPTQVTQSFGTINPIEPTANHAAGDTNFAANMGDPVTVPPGNWTVVKAYNQASPQGAPGDYQDNSGWGNDVWLQDEQGNTLHFLHLAGVNVNPGDSVKGGTVVGSVGDSGNSTGSNLGVEFYDNKGNLNDFTQSPYAQYMPMQQ